jgi:hypothetical protein
MVPQAFVMLSLLCCFLASFSVRSHICGLLIEMLLTVFAESVSVFIFALDSRLTTDSATLVPALPLCPKVAAWSFGHFNRRIVNLSREKCLTIV